MKIKAYELKDFVDKKKCAGYLIYGQNKGLVREKSQIIINTYKDENTEIIKFENDELIQEPGKLINEFNTFSLTAEKKILHILNTKDNLTEIILETLKDVDSNNIIIFETGELTPRSKLRKSCEKESNIGVLACYFDTERDIQDLVNEAFKKENIKISRDIILHISKHLGNERHIIKNEIEKIILFLKDKKEYDEKYILKCLSQNEDFGFEDLNYSICNGNMIKLDRTINQLYLEGINPIALLRSVGKHFQKILFVNEKIDLGMNINESLSQLKPPIFFLYIDQFKKNVKNWKTTLCYKAIERIMETEEICKMNSKISKIVCWRTLRNIASIKYN
tara:strand:+ start:186 stop:1190 length:1005 start_codon:yes stop_codon:yes gene_type:complete